MSDREIVGTVHVKSNASPETMRALREMLVAASAQFGDVMNTRPVLINRKGAKVVAIAGPNDFRQLGEGFNSHDLAAIVWVEESEIPALIAGESRMMPIGIIKEGAPDGVSRCASAIADSLLSSGVVADLAPDDDERLAEMRVDIAANVDARLADIRAHYEALALTECPVVSHHGNGPCAFCLTAAMLDFLKVTPRETVAESFVNDVQAAADAGQLG
jgi:hypothetical protein